MIQRTVIELTAGDQMAAAMELKGAPGKMAIKFATQTQMVELIIPHEVAEKFFPKLGEAVAAKVRRIVPAAQMPPVAGVN